MKLKREKGNLRARWRAYRAVYWAALRGYLYYPKLLQASVLIMCFRMVMMFLVYGYAFRYIGTTMNGIDAVTAVWSIGVYFLLLHSQFRGVAETVNKEIRDGQLETQINKPYSYLAYKFWEHWGKSSLNLFVVLLAGIPLLLLLTGGLPVHFSIGRLIAAAFLVLGGTLVSAAIYLLVAIPALWIDDAAPFFLIVDKTVLVLGGAYVPIALLPGAFQAVAIFAPFGAPMFATQMFNPDFFSRLPLLILSQVFWIFVLGSTLYLLFERARKKLSINGG